VGAREILLWSSLSVLKRRSTLSGSSGSELWDRIDKVCADADTWAAEKVWIDRFGSRHAVFDIEASLFTRPYPTPPSSSSLEKGRA
jgi:hypothetical protein